MTDLLTAIEAAIDKDVEAALHAQHPWEMGDPEQLRQLPDRGIRWHSNYERVHEIHGGQTPILTTVERANYAAAYHIARHDPARVLRQARAHRLILAEHQLLTASSDLFRDGSGGLGDCACCRYPWPCDTVRHLADGYGIEVT